jgi:hypothetical protein
LDQFRTSFDKSRSVFTGISAGISGISENRISRYLPVFFHKREKKPCARFDSSSLSPADARRCRIRPTVHRRRRVTLRSEFLFPSTFYIVARLRPSAEEPCARALSRQRGNYSSLTVPTRNEPRRTSQAFIFSFGTWERHGLTHSLDACTIDQQVQCCCRKWIAVLAFIIIPPSYTCVREGRRWT